MEQEKSVNRLTNKKLIRITTVPSSLQYLLTGQMRFMQERGLDVIMVSAHGDEVEQIIESEGCSFYAIPFTRKINLIGDLKALYLLIKFFRNEKPDIVHSHTPKAGLIGMIAAWLCRVPNRFHTIAGLPLMTANGITQQILKVTEWLTYKCSSKLLVNSNSLKKYLVSNFGWNTNGISMIGNGSSNGIDLNRFSPKKLDAEILELSSKKLNLSSDDINLLFIGRIVKDKGIIELLEALDAVNKKYNKVKLIILGSYEEIRKEESLPNWVKEKIESLEHIKFMGWQSEVEYYLELADCLIHPSHREGFPNVLLQAGAMKCPILCSRIPGNVDVVVDRDTGILFECNSKEAIVEAIEFYINNQSLSEQYAQKLFEEIHLKYKRSIVQEEIYNFYQNNIIL